MKYTNSVWGFELQDSPDPKDQWFPWTKVMSDLEKDVEIDKLSNFLRKSGIVDDKDFPILGRNDFNHFRALEIGFTDTNGQWHAGALMYFITVQGIAEIKELLNVNKLYYRNK